MHLIGKSIKSYAVTPANDTVPLISIPNWDFHWQGVFLYRKLLKIPAGSVVYGEATYDNTSANSANPNNPPLDVIAGDYTTDEMMIVFFIYASYANGDENIVVDTNTTLHTYNNCAFTGIAEENSYHAAVRAYPNPVSEEINFDLPPHSFWNIVLYNSSGQELAKIHSSALKAKMNLKNYSSGFYYVKLFSNQEVIVRKIEIIK
jgi:hypothetical protein